MSESQHRPGPPDIPEAVAAPKSRRTIQLVWLIPLVAVLVGGWLAIKSVLDRGPVITISFKTAEGIEANKTKLKYKDVDVGMVTNVELSRDLSKVIVTAELGKESGPHLNEDTRFWVVRPRISGGSVSGLGTLLAGSYIGVGIGKSKQQRRSFAGLEEPPVFSTDTPGREFVLHSSDLGSLDFGAPIYFRRLQVGQVANYELDKNGRGVTLRIFINAPYDQYVNANTRFWHASGVDVTLDSTGIRVDTQSLVSIVLGGLAFQTPPTLYALPPAEQSTEFDLFPTRAQAMKHPDSIVRRFMVVFNESLRGLEPGASVDFRGISIGEVVSINSRINVAKGQIELPVEINLYPDRLASRQIQGPSKVESVNADPQKNFDQLVARGLRAQLRTGNLLTGQLYISMDFFPNAPKAKVDWNSHPPLMPVMPGTMEDLKSSIAGITKKLEKIDFEGIGADLQQTLKSTTRLVQRLDGELVNLTPELRAVLKDARGALASAERALASNSPVQQDVRDAMREIARAAQSFRVLADYLEQHPEALVSGKKEEKQ